MQVCLQTLCVFHQKNNCTFPIKCRYHFLCSSLNPIILTYATLTSPIFSYRPQKYIWHGSTANGERSLSSYCDAWNSDNQESVGLASSLLKRQLLGQELMSCQNSFAVLCIEATSQSRSRRRRHAASREQELTSQQYEEFLKTLYNEPAE